MGLDLALGVFILLGAIRGWFRGFLNQAVRLGGFLAAVFGAAPLRDYAKPHILPYLTTITPNLLDRMLWWVGAILIYVVGVGIFTLAIKVQKRRVMGEEESNRSDQAAGMWLGALKSAVIASFLLMGFERFGMEPAARFPWVKDQVQTSHVMKWQQKYQPAEKIWTSAPVQNLVAFVRKHGISGPEESATGADPLSTDEPDAPAPPAQAAKGQSPRLELRQEDPAAEERSEALNPASPEFLQNLDRSIEELDRKVGPN